MAVERTLSIIKPDAVKKNVIGQILARFEKAGLRIIAARMTQLSRKEAEGFYAVHRERPFFKDLVEFMISGPVLVQVLEGDDAIARNRDLMGATDPKKAATFFLICHSKGMATAAANRPEAAPSLAPIAEASAKSFTVNSFTGWSV